MAWQEVIERRTDTTKTWCDEATGKFRTEIMGKTALHHSGGDIDMTPQRVDNAQLDGWRVAASRWHYALGHPGDKANDGWVGFGGREGAHWLLSRLLRLGYLHWPTRTWQDVGASPTYDRAKLSQETQTVTVGPEGAEQTITTGLDVEWEDIWNTPGGGALDVTWRNEGRHLKEEIQVNQAAREWVTANRPPTTPLAETWFGFVFELDLSDIPNWHDFTGDANDDATRPTFRDALNRVLAFMPFSYVYSDVYQNAVDPDDGELLYGRDVVRLRKRIWYEGGKVYVLVGVRCDLLNGMHEGGLLFDPTYESPQDNTQEDDSLRPGPYANYNYGVSTAFGTIKGGGGPGILRFDLSSIDGDGTIDSATLTATPNTGDVLTIYIHHITAANGDWIEGTKDAATAGTGEPCWNKKIYNTVNWAGSVGLGTAGTDYDDENPLFSAEVDLTAETPENFTLDNLSIVEGWFGEATNNGMRFTSNSGTSAHTVHTSDHATEAKRPLLTVEWTAAGGVTHEAATAFAGAGTLTSAGLKALLGSSALPGQGALAGVGLRSVLGAATLDGQGALTSAGLKALLAASVLSGQGALTSAGLKTLLSAAALPGQGDLTAAGMKALLAASVLSGQGSLTAAPQRIVLAVSGLPGIGTLVAVGSLGVEIHEAIVALTGQGSLAASGLRAVFPTVALAGQGALTGLPMLILLGATALAGIGSLTVVGTTVTGAVVVELTLDTRSFLLTLPTRSFELTQDTRDLGLTLEDR